MKPGERNALLAVLAGFVGVIAFTAYYEAEFRKREASDAAVQLVSDQIPVPDGIGIGVIPVGINPDDLPEAESRGATVLTLYCAQCHDLPTPAMHTAAEWQPLLARMEERMRARRGGMLMRVLMPGEQDWKILRDYMARHAQHPLDAARYGDLDSPAGQAFQGTCSQCHGAPDPAQHTASEWPRVVVRMKSNMQKTGIPVPDEATVDLINEFLRKHARA